MMYRSDWVLEPNKYLSKEQANRLLNVARSRAKQALLSNRKIPVRDFFIIHLALTTGLRVMEIAALNCSDIFLDDRMCSILVRKGKGGKKRDCSIFTEFLSILFFVFHRFCSNVMYLSLSSDQPGIGLAAYPSQFAGLCDLLFSHGRCFSASYDAAGWHARQHWMLPAVMNHQGRLMPFRDSATTVS